MSSNSNDSTVQTRTYFGWQHEKVAFLFGMSAQRAAMLTGAVLAGIWPLAAARWQASLLLWPAAAILAGLALLRVGGRSTDEWALAFLSFHTGKLRSRHRFLSAAFTPTGSAGPKLVDLPGILAPVTILEGRGPLGGPLAIAHHRLDRTFTAVARVRYSGISLVDSARRDQRVAGWGALLAGLCTEGIR